MRLNQKSKLLRHRADLRTLLWAFVLFPAICLAPYVAPRLAPWLLPLSLYCGFCAGVFSHNHNHCPTFVRRGANVFYSAWISVFYGYPTFAWIPTHNLNHHKYVNREGDATITWRYCKKNTWLVASTFFFVSASFQQPLIREFVRRAKATKPRLYREIVLQRLIVGGGHAALFALAVGLHGWHTGSLAYLGGFGASAAMGLWGLIFINYIQHVHCDPWSDYDHSRNFVSKLGNWLVFNNGYHTAHHENAGIHWSRLAEAHARIAHRIDPELNQKSILGYCLKAYLLGAFDERFRTRPIRKGALHSGLRANAGEEAIALAASAVPRRDGGTVVIARAQRVA